MFIETVQSLWEHSSKLVDLIVIGSTIFGGFFWMKKSVTREIHEDIQGVKNDIIEIKTNLKNYEQKFEKHQEKSDRQDARLDALFMFLLNGKNQKTDP